MLTGETGAGKTMVVSSLQLLLGSRGSSDMVRSGAERARVTALLDVGGTHRRASVASWTLGVISTTTSA